MVTKEMMDKQKFKETEKNHSSYRVTDEDMFIFDEDSKRLPLLLNETIDEFCEESGFAKRVNSQIADMCQIDEKALREYINGKRRITRAFLYKLTIGLGLPKDKANELFLLCGGKLDVFNREDYIVLRAIEDGDEIEDFIRNFNEFSVAIKLK